MSKKILSIVLVVVMLMSVLVVGVNAASDKWQYAVKYTLICGSLGDTKSDSAMKNMVDEYVAADKDILTRNLAFWSDEIIKMYNEAQTESDWETLYNTMRSNWIVLSEDFDLTDFYTYNLLTKKAKMSVKYTADVKNVEKGENVTITISAKSNYYFNAFEAGVIYDKTKLTVVSASAIASQDATYWKQGSVLLDYGFIGGKDHRDVMWPAVYRDNKNGEYDKYGMVKVATAFDPETRTSKTSGTPCARILEDYTPMIQVVFKVNNDSSVSDGDVLDFFSVPKSYPNIEDFEELFGEATLMAAPRALSPIVDALPFEVSDYDIDWSFENASVTVGTPAVEYADYTALDAAIKAYDDEIAAGTLAASDYTPASWTTYIGAVNAGKTLARDILATEQATVTDCAKAITDAKTGLTKNSIVSANVTGSPVIGTKASVDVKVTGSPEFIRLAEKKTENATTFNRDSLDAVIVDNKDGTETWTVKILVSKELTEFEVVAKYAHYAEETKDVTVNASEDLDLSIHSIVIPDMKPNQANGGAIRYGRHDIIITTSQDVYKIQFVAGNIEAGGTYTYCVENPSGNTSYVDKENGERVWTISHVFAMGEWSMPIRTRAESTTFSTTGDNLTARVLY